jgi:hypothetical protein
LPRKHRINLEDIWRPLRWVIADTASSIFSSGLH